MFETAELQQQVSKSAYDKAVPELRFELLEAQRKLLAANFPAIIVFGGVDAAGKNETVNLLNEWMDPRWITTCAYGVASDEEAERPEFWRYWRDLPPKGRIGLFLSAWYSQPILDRVYGRQGEAEFDKQLERIVTFEKELAEDGALILKFWMHLSRDAQKKRFKALERDPMNKWRVTGADWKNLDHYEDFVSTAERAIARTSTGEAAWQIVEGFDVRYCGLTIAKGVRDGLEKHLAEGELKSRLIAEIRTREKSVETAASAEEETGEADGQGHEPSTGLTILSRLDMDQSVAKKEYRKELAKLQARVHRLDREATETNLSTVVVFEGWDAAGKGGAIRRVTSALNARDYRVIPIAAPTDEERQHHYLWRFWRHISRAGRDTFFDRSWYGRVLVERVEGFALEAEWRRAYAEINDFEEQLASHGIVVMKFWIHITKDEQLARFKAREQIPYKRWKLTEEDWRNRERWDLYEHAVNDMVERTSTAAAPWTLVEGNDKRFARLKVLRTICERIEAALGETGSVGIPTDATQREPGKRTEKRSKDSQKKTSDIGSLESA